MAAANPLGWFIERRTSLIERAIPGSAAAAGLSRLTDEAVLSQTRTASSRIGAPFAVLALGGYGAGRLLPGSDIDLLIVSTGTARDLEPLVRSLLYPLWDAGFPVGHQIRTPKDQVRAVRDDLTIASSFMTARPVAGDMTLARHVTRKVFARLMRDARTLLRHIAARERPGSPYLLEPDLKDGAGGQRDIDELVWRAALALGGPADSPSPLVATGLLTEPDMALLEWAQNTITAARWTIHRTDRRVRNTLHPGDEDDLPMDAAVLQQALATVHHTLLDARDRASGSPPLDETPLGIDELTRLARTGGPGLAALERAVHAGRLEHAIPGARESMTLRRPSLSHRYTVGAHTLRTLSALFETPGTDRPIADAEPALVVAALAHDLGKREPGPGHATRGAALTPGIAQRLGLTAGPAADAQALVREHLLLSEVAMTRDLTDEDVVLAAASRIERPGLIGPLFALTAADMRATGPDVWTPWRATLVAELANKLTTALSPGVDGAGIVRAAESTREAARAAALGRGASRTVLAFLEAAPLRYLARRDAARVLRDALLVQSVAGPGAPGRFSLSVASGPVDGTWVLDVIARDRPGLFATISGALTLSGLDTLAADAHTGAAGIALDTFTVTSATRAYVEADTWHTVERILTAALLGRYDIDTRLTERRRHYPGPARTVPPVVSVEGAGVSTATVRVRAIDRMGLLHDLARACQTAGLDIRRAVISTDGDRADDIFELSGCDGSAPSTGTLDTTLVPGLERAAAR